MTAARGKKTTAKKAAGKKTAARKTTAKKAAAKKATSARTSKTRSAPRKTTARKTTAKKTAARKTTARKTTAKKAAARKTTARKTAAKKSPARKTASKTTARKTTTAKAPAAKTAPAATAKPATKPVPIRRPAPPPKRTVRPAKFDAEGLRKIRANLVSQRSDLERQQRELEQDSFGETQSGMTGEVGLDEDFADAGSATFDREQALSIRNNIRDLIDQVTRAIEKIDQGTYGTCERCGNPIDATRIKALPHALLCLDCKRREERAR